MNYRDVENKLRSIGTEYGQSTSRFIPGNNLLTRNIVGVYELGDSLIVELSYGRGMGDYYIYGVTFKDNKNTDFSTVNKCCHEFDEVEETIKAALIAFTV